MQHIEEMITTITRNFSENYEKIGFDSGDLIIEKKTIEKGFRYTELSIFHHNQSFFEIMKQKSINDLNDEEYNNFINNNNNKKKEFEENMKKVFNKLYEKYNIKIMIYMFYDRMSIYFYF